MASSGKRKTTMAKLARESRLRERRMEKQARKAARKLASAEEPSDTLAPEDDQSSQLDSEPPALESVVQTLGES